MRNSSTRHRLHVLSVGRDDGHLRPGMRTSKKLIEEPLMKRRRTLLAGLNRPVQLARGVGRSSGRYRWPPMTSSEIGRIHAHARPTCPRSRRVSREAALRATSRSEVAERALADS